MTSYRYEIEPRAPELGGGWRLRLIEVDDEVGGGVFPPTEAIEDAKEALADAYGAALDEAQAWLASRDSS